MNLRHRLKSLHPDDFSFENTVFFKEIVSDDDLAAAIFDLSLPDDQQDLVNPAGFSIGRAYLFPKNNIPYLICIHEQEKMIPIGLILLRFISASSNPNSWNYYYRFISGTSWSFFIDFRFQNKGYGKKAARLAMHLLKKAAPEFPILLMTEEDNHRAQKLYLQLGFEKTNDRDGDDLIFICPVDQQDSKF